MEQKDYLKRQIDRFGRALGKIAAYLPGLKAGDIATQGTEFASRTLKSEIDLDMESLMAVKTDDLIDFLITG